ncbi:MAG: class I SAM-dependent methyltransferase [Mariprofundales bacterium]|nr:class I SAM-dependent methyltransferase [Mariprofundales bacterium]
MTIDPRQLHYCAEVLRFRRALNLTSVDNEADFIDRFIAPSIALLPWLPDGALVLDIGSGMGVPGIPLLIARGDLHGILVERRKKRAEFLRHIVRELSLPCEVYADDIAKLPPLNVDAVVARAVAEPAVLLNMSREHVCEGGIALLPSGESRNAGDVDGWCMRELAELQFDDSVKQQVYCYQRVVNEEVSRET